MSMQDSPKATGSFFQRIEHRARAVDSLLVVGLDPHAADLTRQDASSALAFCTRLVEATHDLAVAYKPNAAFFERFGGPGQEALQSLIRDVIPADVPVILDGKRGDIGSTARAYADAAFNTLGADALTINGYLGADAISPFITRADRGAFVLCKTSNQGAADLQDLIIASDGRPLYLHVADLANRLNDSDNIGVVVGATQLEALSAVRRACPDLWLLAPGVGAQGGTLETAVSAGLRGDGLGIIVPVSRGISRAPDPRAAAIALRDGIRAAQRHAQDRPVNRYTSLANGLLDAECVRFGTFTLKSGKTSPIYIDLRRLIAHPRLLHEAALAYLEILRDLRFDHIAALPYAALPIGSAVSLAGGLSMVYPRREAKAYGTKVAVEGVYQPGDRTVVLDDLATTGGSKVEAIEKLDAVGLRTEDIVVLIDRQSGARETLTEAGYRFHAVFTLRQLVSGWLASGRITAEQAQDVRTFLDAG
jgi:uridine monophosphate synthetase